MSGLEGSARKDAELAWAAGFFDGEGTITTSLTRAKPEAKARQRSQHATFYVGVNQATSSLDDIDTPEAIARFARALGMGVVVGPYRQDAHRKPIFKWYAHNRIGLAALSVLWPYLCSPKRLQARRAFDRFEHLSRIGAELTERPWEAAA